MSKKTSTTIAARIDIRVLASLHAHVASITDEPITQSRLISTCLANLASRLDLPIPTVEQARKYLTDAWQKQPVITAPPIDLFNANVTDINSTTKDTDNAETLARPDPELIAKLKGSTNER